MLLQLTKREIAMKLNNYYSFIKERMLTGLSEYGYTVTNLKSIFAATAKEYGFSRSCVLIGCQFTKFWINDVKEHSNINIKDAQIHTVYKRFFRELGFK